MCGEMEILNVGNELLIGKIENTNAQWLAKQATSMSILVKRITVVRDDCDETATAIREILKRTPQFIVTTGGLGPTFDDKTLESIAKALRRKLEVNEKALQMIREKYLAYTAETGKQISELTPPRIKMATIPEKAEVIQNPVGTAPAVKIDLKETVLIALPGVPMEMEAIFKKSVLPLLAQASNGAAYAEDSIFVDDIMESILAPLIDQTMRDNPGIYVKSHPRGAENMPHIEIHLSTTAANKQEAEDKIRKALIPLSDSIQRHQGRVLSKNQFKV